MSEVEVVKNKREQVKDCIALGTMTKAEIAVELDMSAGSVSTQMTYLRWMDNNIMSDSETKILTFVDQETWDAHMAAKEASKGSGKKASTRTPAERAVAVAKTIATQEKAKAKWDAKIVEVEELLATMPDDADAALNMKEAVAQVAIAEVKITRNEALAATLPDLEEATAEVEATASALAAETAVEDVENDVDEDSEATDELL